ncbi:MAG: 5-formyltetrahydrofolate cyclo-ligase [bacterium]|nr:MAG: 5-formyltetrahydrofolate cyclo-ligase [bacterium]
MSRAISQEKLAIREMMKAMRQGLSPEEVGHSGQAVSRMTMSQPEANSAGSFCVYASVGKEVATGTLILELLESGKTVVVPDWEGWKQGCGLRVARIQDPGDLLVENRVVPQPRNVPERIMPIDRVEVFLIPGVAYDMYCNRIGMGGGYYDRLLALSSPKATLIGLAYDFQIMHSLPVDDHDVPVHKIVTPSQCVTAQDQHKRRVTEDATRS